MANNQPMFVLQLQVPIIAGDIVEAQEKARNMVSYNADAEKIPYTFFQVVPANQGDKK